MPMPIFAPQSLHLHLQPTCSSTPIIPIPFQKKGKQKGTTAPLTLTFPSSFQRRPLPLPQPSPNYIPTSQPPGNHSSAQPLHSKPPCIDTTAHIGHSTLSRLFCCSHTYYLFRNLFTPATLFPIRGVRQRRQISWVQPHTTEASYIHTRPQNTVITSSLSHTHHRPRQNFSKIHPHIAWGDPHTPPSPSHIRVVFQNCKTLSRDHFTQYSYLNKLMLLQLHIIGLAETNLNWSHFPTKTSIYSLLKA